jgi:hypothetical protein
MTSLPSWSGSAGGAESPSFEGLSAVAAGPPPFDADSGALDFDEPLSDFESPSVVERPQPTMESSETNESDDSERANAT